MGAMAMNANTRDSAFTRAGMAEEAKVGAAGIQGAGMVKEAGILADAQAGLANAQGNAAMMGALGDIGGSLLGGIKPPSAGGGSSTPIWSNTDSFNAYNGNMNVGGQPIGGFISPDFNFKV